MRARLFSQCGLVDVLGPEERGPRQMAQALEEALARPRLSRPRVTLDLDGVARASAALLAELPDQRKAAAAPLLSPLAPEARARATV
jgi:predicted glycosyltransferase